MGTSKFSYRSLTEQLTQLMTSTSQPLSIENVNFCYISFCRNRIFYFEINSVDPI